MKSAILAALATAATLSAVELATILGVSERGTRKVLYQMHEDGDIRRVTSLYKLAHRYRYALPLAEPVRWYPWAQAGEYTWAVHTGSVPDEVRRLMAEIA